MPYDKFRENNKLVIYKVNDQGEKVGKPLGSHNTEQEADAQVRALYANEKKEQPETEDKMMTDVREVQIYIPDYTGPISFAEMQAERDAREQAMKVQEMAAEFPAMAQRIMSRNDIENKSEALANLAKEFTNMTREVMQKELTKEQKIEDEVSKSFLNKMIDLFKKDEGKTQKEQETKEFFVWKEDDTYRWMAAYSNNRRDNDNPPEIISSDSHKAFDENLQKGLCPMPELWLWHVNYPVGITQYHTYDESTGFPVAAGIFNKDCEWAAEGIIKAKWNGVSHGMPTRHIKRDKEDNSIITQHVTKEITILPAWAAANKLSFHLINKEAEMQDEKGLPEHKRQEFIEAFGEERVAQMEAALADKAKQADEENIEKKEEKPVTRTEILEVVTQLNDAIKALAQEVTELKERAEEKDKEPQTLLEMLELYRAVGKSENKVDGRTKEAKDIPQEAEAQPQNGIANIFAPMLRANQEAK